MGKAPCPDILGPHAQPPLVASVSRFVTRVDTEVPLLAELGTAWRWTLLTGKLFASFWKRKQNRIYWFQLKSCPSESAYNFCKTDVPADERCGSSSTNSVDIDISAYSALTGTGWSSGSPNLLVNISPSSCWCFSVGYSLLWMLVSDLLSKVSSILQDLHTFDSFITMIYIVVCGKVAWYYVDLLLSIQYQIQ
jgi:hypothetical protein